ncbi:hypothetical protein ABPG72_017326 [Tetrahymena utriculariae]
MINYMFFRKPTLIFLNNINFQKVRTNMQINNPDIKIYTSFLDIRDELQQNIFKNQSQNSSKNHEQSFKADLVQNKIAFNQNDYVENQQFIYKGIENFTKVVKKDVDKLQTKKDQEQSEYQNNQWDEGLIVFNNIEEQISFQQTNEFENDEQIKMIQNLQDSKKKQEIEKQTLSFENFEGDQILLKKQIVQREQFDNYTKNLKSKQKQEKSVQYFYLIEKSNNLDIQIKENKQEENKNKDLTNSFKTEGVVLSRRKAQLKRSNSELQISSESNLKNNYNQNQNKKQKKMLSTNDIIDLDQSTNQIFTKSTTIQKEEKEDSKQTLDINQDLLIQNHQLKMQESQNLQADGEIQSLKNEEQNPPPNQEIERGGLQKINQDNQVQNVSQQENQIQQEKNNQNESQYQEVAAPQNQSDEYSFQLEQTQAYISSLRYRLELRTQSINSLNCNLCQKVKFKKILLIIFYLPLCIGFLYLLIRNAAQFCSPTILVHFCLYTLFSFRNFFLNLFVYIKSQQHLNVLKLYEVNVLSHDLFFFLLCDLQTQYKKQKYLQNKIEQISIQQPQDQEQAIQNDCVSNNNNNNNNQINANIENNQAINNPQNNYMLAQQNIQIYNNQQVANNNISMHQIDQTISEEYVQLIMAAIKYQQSQQQSQSQVNNIVNQNNNNNNNNNQNSNNNNENININSNAQINNINISNSNNNIENPNQIEGLIAQNAQNTHEANKQGEQNIAAIENYYLIQVFNLTISIIKEANILKCILLNSPNIRENRVSYDYYQKHLLQINRIVSNNLKDTDYLIENNQQMIYQINSSLIQREIETIIKYKDRIFLTCKRKKEIKTFSLNDIKNTLQSTKKYTEQELSELCCIICLVEFEEKDQVYLSDCCKRCFHKSCIMEWFKVNQKCPMCRAVVLQ